MAVLLNPPTYLSPLDLVNNIGGDYDLTTTYTDAQRLNLVVAASAKADAMMRRSLLPTERTKRYYGDGTSALNLYVNPLLYVRSLRFALPGVVGFNVPASQMLLDYQSGSILEFTPFAFSGLGYTSVFPYDVPIDVTLASGYGLAIPAPSAVVFTDTAISGLTAGSYDVAITSQTINGESTATVHTVATVGGTIAISFQPVLGAYGYRVYAAAQGVTPLRLVQEIPGSQLQSVYGGYSPVTTRISTLAPPPGSYGATLPPNDTTAQPFPGAVIEATSLLAMQMIYERNNLANRGIRSDQRPDSSGTKWESSMGSQGKGEAWNTAEARRLLTPYSLMSVY